MQTDDDDFSCNSSENNLTDGFAFDELVARVFALALRQEPISVAAATAVDKLLTFSAGSVEEPAVKLSLTRTGIFF